MLAVWWATLVVLVIWRRWRHLLVCAVALFVVTLASTVASDALHRPRPLGVEILGPWTESALPSVPMAFLTAILVTGLYTLVPAGRLRERGKLVVAVLLGVTALSRFYLAQEGPFDVLFAVVIGVAIPLVAFRLFVPNEAFPVSYRRGRTAHLDVSGTRHDAIAHALEEQLGVIRLAIKPFNLEGSGGSTRCGSRSRATRRRTCSPSCIRPPTCARTAGTSSVARCSTASWRTRRRSTRCADWCSTRTTCYG